jgi:hypothetical protein
MPDIFSKTPLKRTKSQSNRRRHKPFSFGGLLKSQPEKAYCLLLTKRNQEINQDKGDEKNGKPKPRKGTSTRNRNY